MGQVREVDAISDAIMETEKEIAGDAWGNEETSAIDETGTRTLESMGEGLEGQHEHEDDAGSEEQDGDDTEGEEEAEEGEDGEEDEGEAEAGEEGKGETKPEPKAEQREPKGFVPSAKMREAGERARAAEAERDALKAQREEDRKELETLKTQFATLTQVISGQQRQSPQAAKVETKVEPPELPDIFENPKGFTDHVTGEVKGAVGELRAEMRRQSVEFSFELSHVRHGAAFENAMQAINGLNAQNPDDRATVQRIYNSPNPGEELVKWHKRSTALSRVGDDPDAYDARLREETRQALLKDPEFRKQLIADIRGEAQTGENGAPRTTTRLPKSLARAGGSNLGVERGDHDRHDNSEQSVADAAWR